ncbi:transposase [Skermanella rosea]|uniref:transposase n=1 Tax=Skermanella rosea TaxID=1817965 RepID=UPI001933B9B4|nr:transposase [Skermanella rosea]UEM05742.1 transposase [Skermanella rosea]
MLLLTRLHVLLPTIVLFWADSSYQGLNSWIQENLGWTLTIARHWWTGVRGFWCAPGQEPPTIPAAFHVLPRRWRWVVERSLTWFCRNYRLAKDYERLPETGEMFFYMALSRILNIRLEKHLELTT